MFHINVDKPTQRVRIHKSSCKSIPTRVKDKKNGHWTAYDDVTEAFNYAKEYARPNWDVAPCAICEPSQPPNDIFAQLTKIITTREPIDLP